jgi:hypothetical protein
VISSPSPLIATPGSRESGPPGSSTTNSLEDVVLVEEEADVSIELDVEVLKLEVDVELGGVDVVDDEEEVDVLEGPLVTK